MWTVLDGEHSEKVLINKTPLVGRANDRQKLPFVLIHLSGINLYIPFLVAEYVHDHSFIVGLSDQNNIPALIGRFDFKVRMQL